MEKIKSDKNLIAFCGLYCGACRRYLSGKCSGCHEYAKATWCKLRTCCLENSYATCADCKYFVNPNDCKKFNNWISKLFALFFKSDRKGCIDRIKKVGLEKYAQEMAKSGKSNRPVE